MALARRKKPGWKTCHADQAFHPGNCGVRYFFFFFAFFFAAI